MSSRGETREQPSASETPELSAEHAFLGLGVASLTAAVVALIVEEQTTVVILRGGYSILTGLFVCGCVGYFGGRLGKELARLWPLLVEARQLLRQLHALLVEIRQLLQQLQGQATRPAPAASDAEAERDQHLVELTKRLGTLSGQIEELTRARAKPAHRPGPAHPSQAAEKVVGVQSVSVDAATDPSGVTLQRIREEGIEEGFDIGLRTRLADLGVPTLPRPRRRRLTSDS